VPLLIERQSGETQLFAKQVTIEDQRYIVCRNETEAEKDRKDREAIVGALDAQLRKSSPRRLASIAPIYSATPTSRCRRAPGRWRRQNLSHPNIRPDTPRSSQAWCQRRHEFRRKQRDLNRLQKSGVQVGFGTTVKPGKLEVLDIPRLGDGRPSDETRRQLHQLASWSSTFATKREISPSVGNNLGWSRSTACSISRAVLRPSQ